jgi:hypothetical protein
LGLPESRPTTTDPASPDLRVERALRVTARALTGYGLLSIAVAGLALVATLIIAIGLNASTQRLVDRVGQVTSTLDRTALALDQAVVSAGTLSATLDALGPTLTRTTSSLRSGAETLTRLAAAADRISLFGQRPFADLTSSLTATATELDALAVSLEGNAVTLEGSKAAATRMAQVLPPVAASLRTLRTDLEPDVRALLDDVWRIVPLAGVAFALWLGVPGAGAYVLGRRIHRALDA